MKESSYSDRKCFIDIPVTCTLGKHDNMIESSYSDRKCFTKSQSFDIFSVYVYFGFLIYYRILLINCFIIILFGWNRVVYVSMLVIRWFLMFTIFHNYFIIIFSFRLRAEEDLCLNTFQSWVDILHIFSKQ